jgi:hypothetical protein
MPARPKLSSIAHQWPIFFVHIHFGQRDLLPGRHEDIVQLHAVRLDLFPRLFENYSTVFTRLQILRQRSIRRTGAAPTPFGRWSTAQFQMDRIHPERTEITQMLVVEVAD